MQQLQQFEHNNRSFGVNIIQWCDDKPVRKLRQTPHQDRELVINIMLIEDHFVGVTNLNKLLNSNTNGHNGNKYCFRCLRPFHCTQKLKEHSVFCIKNDVIQEKMPANKEFCFNKWGKTISPTFVFYGDIECLLLPDGKHQPVMAAFLLLPDNRVLQQPEYRVFEGHDCIQQFLHAMEEKAIDCNSFNENHLRTVMQPMTSVQLLEFNQAEKCYLCQRVFGTLKKCRDHDHFSGNYRGAACLQCNALLREQRSTFPVVFHNWRGYDSHHIICIGAEKMTKWELAVIPTTKETYLNMRARVPIPGSKVGTMKKERRLVLNFIDSLQFLSASLSSLAQNCPVLSLTSTLPGSTEVKSGKGIFPYNYFDSPEKMAKTELPPMEAFFNELTQLSVTEAEYKQAQKAWSEFRCSTMGDYMKGTAT